MSRGYKKAYLGFCIALILQLSLNQAAFAAKPCTIIDPTVTDKRSMSFGQITVGFTGGTIDTNGIITGDVVTFRGVITKGQIILTACKNTAINVSYLDGTLTNGSYSMPVTILTNPSVEIIPNPGRLTIDIDGRLNVGGLQEPGDYTGFYTIVIDY